MPGMHLGARGKKLVANLLEFFEQEKANGGPFIPVTAVRERVAAALKINPSTVTIVTKAIQNGESLDSKKRVRTKPVTGVDEFTECAIRNEIYRMYDNHEHITVHNLCLKLQSAELFKGCDKSLNTLLRRMGFTYRKDNPRRALIELPHIALKRFEFLVKYMRIKREGIYQFVHLDETWIFQNGTVCRSWQNNDVRTVRSTQVDGKRFIVLHAGNENGFIEGSELIFSSATKYGDYHGEMNETNFLNWFENQLLKNLEQPSVIVLDNASYHSTVLVKEPNYSWTKGDISNWLTNQGVPHDCTSFKKDLLNLANMHKPQKIYKADYLAKQYGHEVVRLPPYHCFFNPIELVWGISKTYYNRHIGRNGKSAENCFKMWHEALATITSEVWANSVAHCERLIGDWYNREVRLDTVDVAPLIINIDDRSWDSDSCSN